MDVLFVVWNIWGSEFVALGSLENGRNHFCCLWSVAWIDHAFVSACDCTFLLTVAVAV